MWENLILLFAGLSVLCAVLAVGAFIADHVCNPSGE